MKKWGKIHIFSPIRKKYAYVFPNWLKIYKIAKKGEKTLNIFYEDISIEKWGGGKNVNLKFDMHPLIHYM